MPLPTIDQPWPPLHMQHIYSKMNEWAAWYSGEPERIMQVYSRATPPVGAGVPWWRFWTRVAQPDGAKRALLHVPLAGDLAATSGALLFGEPPRVRVRKARADEVNQEPPPQAPLDAALGAAPPVRKLAPESPEDKSEARLLQIMEEGGVFARLVEAAESAAAIGGVYIYPVWDTDLRDFPIMAIAQSDMAVPEFKHGILTAVTFHRTLYQRTSSSVVRLLERHEVEGTGDARKAVVLSAMYEGTVDRLGRLTTLGSSDTWDGKPPEPRVELPFKELDVEYVPNIMPNRLWRAESLGVADIQGSETLLDALDEVYASWMRDIRLAKARILVPREYLRPDGDNTPSFDIDQEVYVGMDMDPGLTQDARAMLAHQFAIRYLEHRETSRELIDRIVSNAGYSPATLGHHTTDRTTGTGTALRIAEHKTLLTLRKKSGWWTHAIANTLYRMQLIDAEIFASGVEAIRPTVDISDSIIDNPLELAQTALALSTAMAASIESRVRIVNPDWSESEIDAEVIRIQNEEQAAKPPPAIGAFGAGDMASTGQKPITQPSSGGPSGTPPPQAKKPA